MNKLIFVTLLAIGGTVFVVARLIITAVTQVSTHARIRSIRKNPALAREYGEAMDIPYVTKNNFPYGHFEKLIAYLGSVSQVGNYRILHTAPYDVNHLLVFTEFSFVDFDVNVTGKASDVTKKAYHDFLLRHEPEGETLTILSDIYVDTNSKFQKQEFVNAVFKGV